MPGVRRRNTYANHRLNNGVEMPLLGFGVFQIAESLGAVDVQLDAEELAICNDAWFKLPRQSET
jgi:hypothetical protein